MRNKIYLYKYRPDNDYTIQALSEHRLHFSNPKDFNDPFDCRTLCAETFTDEYIIDDINKTYPSLTGLAQQRLPAIKQLLNNSNYMGSKVNSVFEKLFVLCMSCNADLPPMWAHYADNHKGVCLGFDTDCKGQYLDGVVRKVEYVDKFQPLDFLANDKDSQIKNIVTQKSKYWEYEEEVRIIKTPEQMYSTGKLTNSFPPRALVAMFFGLYMPKERQDFYIDFCKQCGLNNVQFFKMTMPTDGTYHFVPKKISL